MVNFFIFLYFNNLYGVILVLNIFFEKLKKYVENRINLYYEKIRIDCNGKIIDVGYFTNIKKKIV